MGDGLKRARDAARATRTPKAPTPQGISALLKRAGFERSVSSASRIKGLRNYSAGFLCGKDYAGGVEVRHKTGFDRGERARAEMDEMLPRYAEAIRAAGWNVEYRADIHRLTVTAKEAGQ